MTGSQPQSEGQSTPVGVASAAGRDVSGSSRECTAAVFTGVGRPLELRRFPVPDPQATEAVVRVECCTICGSDLHTLSGKRAERTPSILGHEAIGVVVSVGEPPLCAIDGRPLAAGDRVTWSSSVSCGHCDRCRAGLPQKCRTLAKYGHELAEGRFALSGGMAEYILLRQGSTVIRIPNDFPAEVICPANCATATIVAACRVAGDVAGRRVLIFGAGMLGLMAAAWTKTAGASAVVVCDPDPRRCDRSLKFGADHSVTAAEQLTAEQGVATNSGGAAFDVVLELSGSPDAVEAAVAAGGLASHIVLVGTVMPCRPVQLDPEQVVRRWQSIHGVHNYTPDDLQQAVRFLVEHASSWPFGALFEPGFTLSQINDAVNDAMERRPVRTVIRP